MPGLTVLRPADANETAACWRLALQRNGPAALVLTRQNLPIIEDIERARAGVLHGAYVLADAVSGPPNVLLLATGSEVWVALGAREVLAQRGIQARVVSMPSWEVFEEQPQAYKDDVLPPSVRARVAVEAAATFGWRKYVGEKGEIVGIDRFGASAPGKVVFEQFGLTPEAASDRAAAVVEGLARKGT